MEGSNSEDKAKPPGEREEKSDEPPLLHNRKPFFLSKRKSKSYESQIQGVLLRLLIMRGYRVVVKKPKIAKKSLPFLTILSLHRETQTIYFKKELEDRCKQLESKKEGLSGYSHQKVMKYTQRNRIALTCNYLLKLLCEDNFAYKERKSKESIETVQLVKFSELWSEKWGVCVCDRDIVRIGEDMIAFITETFDKVGCEQIVFGKEYYYGYESINHLEI
ncbi:hypothetical protein EIN_178370 [Entamoeba invadens IP1]|uniref:hypothetical protein n=1 Tax=Entamoeba invadens IP1 TaxID=370355 RepID=UPI0002C3EB4B|nr:hypothetical protein EIN_178370 [Entamoeba invadens IP1]ELP93900.1 hypothetical protein EIN_178370 [Entamoeba invadens IP1]|eukprot:XP_004260671.1 hypothetical protein EIN_178370 [Entamoeba invadens IP1]